MSLRIRMSRGGAKKRPYYHIVIADARSPRDGRYIERVGSYNPMVAKDHPDRIKLLDERIKYWLGVGAQPSDRVARFLGAAGIIEKRAIPVQTKQNLPRAKTLERMKEAEEAAKAKAESAAAAKVEDEAAAAKAEEEAAAAAKAKEEAAAEAAKAKEEAAAEAAKAAESKAEEAPAEEAKTEEAPAEEAKTEEAPAEEEKSGEEKSGEEKSGQKKAGEEKPEEEKAAN